MTLDPEDVTRLDISNSNSFVTLNSHRGNPGASDDKKRYDFFVPHPLNVEPSDWNEVDKKKATIADGN